MKVNAYAKLNLGLEVASRKPQESKHQLKSLFIRYEKLFDIIEIHYTHDFDVIEYYDANDQLMKIDNCLIIKTLKYLRTQNLISNYYFIKIKKMIPMGSGLGGGSSDAGAIIRTLVNEKSLDLLEIAQQLGSDIPFFIRNCEWAIVSGYGEVVEPINIKIKKDIEIIDIIDQVKTKEIYDFFDRNPNPNLDYNNYNVIIQKLGSPKPLGWLKVFNHLYDSLCLVKPKFKAIFEQLKNQNPNIYLSGSGGTIFMVKDQPKKIRTRYAPSPTGFFHIGGARTAIFNYLYAKHHHGDFIVRIEDTDVERNVEGGIESQLDNLKWMKIIPDESVMNPGKYGPYVQSAKLDRYVKLAHQLLKEDKAYYCFCSEEQLEADRQAALDNHQTPKYSRRCLHLSQAEIETNLKKQIPAVIRLKIADNHEYSWNDLIRGKISVPSSAMTDPVILKSNGIAMYNFAVVVDDYDMEITHVLRGEEHISNTPYQIAIRDALGFDNGILYGHLSVIIDETGKKLSKRNKTLKQFVEDYKLMGFIPEAIVNFLALLGWTPSHNQEILNPNELINDFDIDKLSVSPTFFDYKKLLWIGNEYFKNLDENTYLDFVNPFVITHDWYGFLIDEMPMVLNLFKNQISYAKQLNELVLHHFLIKPILTDEQIQFCRDHKNVIHTFYELVKQNNEWKIDTISDMINEVKKQTSTKGKDLFMPIRIATTMLEHGPELAKMIYLTSKENVLNNLSQICQHLEEK